MSQNISRNFETLEEIERLSSIKVKRILQKASLSLLKAIAEIALNIENLNLDKNQFVKKNKSVLNKLRTKPSLKKRRLFASNAKIVKKIVQLSLGFLAFLK